MKLRRILIFTLLFLACYSDVNIVEINIQDLQDIHTSYGFGWGLKSDKLGYYVPKQELEFQIPEGLGLWFIYDGYEDRLSKFPYELNDSKVEFMMRYSATYYEPYWVNFSLSQSNNPAVLGEFVDFVNPFYGWGNMTYIISYPETWVSEEYSENPIIINGDFENLEFKLDGECPLQKEEGTCFDLWFPSCQDRIFGYMSELEDKGCGMLFDFDVDVYLNITPGRPKDLGSSSGEYYDNEITYRSDLISSDKASTMQVLMHEFTHAMLQKTLPGIFGCNWFSEGLAEHYGTFYASRSFDTNGLLRARDDGISRCNISEGCLESWNGTCACGESRRLYDYAWRAIDEIAEKCELSCVFDIWEDLNSKGCDRARTALYSCCGNVTEELETSAIVANESLMKFHQVILELRDVEEYLGYSPINLKELYLGILSPEGAISKINSRRALHESVIKNLEVAEKLENSSSCWRLTLKGVRTLISGREELAQELLRSETANFTNRKSEQTKLEERFSVLESVEGFESYWIDIQEKISKCNVEGMFTHIERLEKIDRASRYPFLVKQLALFWHSLWT